MKACPNCEQQNPDDAQYCLRCGTSVGASSAEETAEPVSDAPVDERQLWQTFIGPSKAIQFSLREGWSWQPAYLYYVEKFRQFQSGSSTRFALTWHWPAFLIDPFLWFLYRKMYMYALVYALGPVLSAYLTGDLSVGIVWRIMAGASANYIYFWHIKDYLVKMRARTGLDNLTRERLLLEEGGIQPYVLWLAVALHLLMLGIIFAAIQGEPPEGEFLPQPEAVPDQKFF